MSMPCCDTFEPRNKPFFYGSTPCVFNQDDHLEKVQQIPKMGRIYEEAAEVWIWLGPGTHQTASTFELFRQIRDLEQGDHDSIVHYLMLYFFSRICDGLEYFYLDIYCLPWFSRRWVIHEALLARRATFHCGKAASRATRSPSSRLDCKRQTQGWTPTLT